MFSAFLVALREGVEVALIVGICLAYLRKIGRANLERPVWWAVAAAAVTSLAAASLLERLAWNQESVEGFLMLLAALLLSGMILWMRRVARSLRGEIESQVGRLAGRGRLAALGVFFFAFAMVLREGLETVIFLSAVALTNQGIPVLLGTFAGLALAVALGVFFFEGTLPIRLDRFFDATSIMLIVIAVQLTLTGVHELSEGLVIPSGPWMMHLLGPIVRHDIFFFVVLLSTAVWLVARELLRRHHTAPATSLSEAERRRRLSEQRRERRWMTAAAATAFLIMVALAAEHVYARGTTQLSPALPIAATGDSVRIPLAGVNDGLLHRFRFLRENTSLGFFVLRLPDGRLAAALEACTICGTHGYYQEGDTVVCEHCAAAIPVAYLDTPGGCNPPLLAAGIEDGTLVIPVSELLGRAHSLSLHHH
ncbi:MAG: Fe-S-containing protein [Candidatus Acidiferrales bacterium]